MKTIRTRKDIQNHLAVELIVEYEGEEGWWVYLKEGWVSPETGCGTIHEHTIADLIPYINNIQKIKIP